MRPTPMHDIVTRLADDIRRAESGLPSSFHTVFQPIVSVKPDISIVAFEALSRWQPNSHPISPAVFIPIAEDNHMIDQLCLVVFDSVLTVAKETGQRVSFNISPKQLSREFVRALIERKRLRSLGARLEIVVEITEGVHSAITGEIELILELQSAGFQVAIDDFGKEGSTFERVLTLPVNMVKVDRYFMRELSHQKGQSVLHGLVRLLLDNDFQVIVEGVEHPWQHDAIKSLPGALSGNIFFQGYLYAHPAPIDEILTLSNANDIYLQPLHSGIRKIV